VKNKNGLRLLAAIGTIGFLLCGCASSSASRTPLPLEIQQAKYQSPTAQEQLSEAVREAVDKAIDSENWKASVRGKRVAVEINSVLAMQYDQLPGYVKGRVESELSKAGAIVIKGKAVAIGSKESTAITLEDTMDYRVIVNLREGGAEITNNSFFDGNKFLAECLGTLGSWFTVSMLAGFGFDSGEAAVSIGSIPLIVGVIVYFVNPPTRTEQLLTSKVALDINMIPQNGYAPYYSFSGDGESVLKLK
jgi:hypothetical protein